MKELTIEQKAKAYDEALEKAKDMLSYKEVRQEDMEYIFPELKEKESEDERIRKALINYFKTFPYGSIDDAGTNVKEAIAWLEKQGCVKESGIPQHENKMCKENDDSLTSDERIKKAVIEMIHDTPNAECEENYNVRKEDVLAWFEKQGEQKPVEWSVEDSNGLQNTIALIEGVKNINSKDEYCMESCEYCLNWLKSFRPQKQWKPTRRAVESTA